VPGRDSEILGLAAAQVLGIPAEPFVAGREDTVVIAYDLNETAAVEGGPELLGQLFERVPGRCVVPGSCDGQGGGVARVAAHPGAVVAPGGDVGSSTVWGQPAAAAFSGSAGAAVCLGSVWASAEV